MFNRFLNTPNRILNPQVCLNICDFFVTARYKKGINSNNNNNNYSNNKEN